MPNGIYDSTGAIRVTVVDGLTATGLYAADGGLNVVIEPAGLTGVYHPCGALNVKDATLETTYGPYSVEGWRRVTTTRNGYGGLFVTALA
jgi:hypothetical protein